MNAELASRPRKFVLDPSSEWWKIINDKLEKNRISVQKSAQDKTVPLNYYAAFDEVLFLKYRELNTCRNLMNYITERKPIMTELLPTLRSQILFFSN